MSINSKSCKNFYKFVILIGGGGGSAKNWVTVCDLLAKTPLISCMYEQNL